MAPNACPMCEAKDEIIAELRDQVDDVRKRLDSWEFFFRARAEGKFPIVVKPLTVTVGAASTDPVSLPDGSDTTQPSGKWPSTTGSTDDR